MEYIFRGVRKNSLDLIEPLQELNATISADLGENRVQLRKIIWALGQIGEKLKNEKDYLIKELCELGLSEEEAQETKIGATYVLNERGLYNKVKRELFETPLQFTRRESTDLQLEAYMSLGVLGHVTSSNDPVLPFLSAVEGLLTGNVNIIKTARNGSGVVLTLTETLCEICPELSSYMYVLPISSKEPELLRCMFDCCDGIAVWGSEGAVSGVRDLAAPGIRIIDWGHRISFAYFTEAGRNRKSLEDLAAQICSNEQQACSSPQVIYYETEDKEALKAFAKEVYDVMAEISPRYPLHGMTPEERAELTTQTQLCELKEIMGDGICLNGGSFRIFVEYDHELSSSPLYRSIIVKPMTRKDIILSLRPFRSYLQTVGLSCAANELVDLTHRMMKAGATRVTTPSKMLDGYEGEPHDGVYALSRYVKRVSLTSEVLPQTIMTLDEMVEEKEAPFEIGTPVMKKADFHVDAPEDDGQDGAGKLIIKSGGSSGKAVYAPHTYADADETYRTTAYGLISAGVKPGKDVCMNLFYCGDMYGGFISVYEALKLAGVTQLPMAACMDLDIVVKEIIANKANVLVGMPSYLIRLFDEKKEELLAYGGIEMMLYGGEHFDPVQIAFLQETFGIRHIGSMVYGCNELGSIGYTCECCTGTQHHVLASKYVEILKMDSDEPVVGNEVGRIVLTPVDQEHIKVKRYEIGDLGRFITEPCGCGRLEPKFELLGRFGDTFKFATNYVNARRIKSVFTEKLGYTGWIQLVLEYDGISKMTIKIEEDIPNAVEVLRAEYPEIEECIRDKTAEIICVSCKKEGFEISTGGGKVRAVVDKRV